MWRFIYIVILLSFTGFLKAQLRTNTEVFKNYAQTNSNLDTLKKLRSIQREAIQKKDWQAAFWASYILPNALSEFGSGNDLDLDLEMKRSYKTGIKVAKILGDSSKVGMASHGLALIYATDKQYDSSVYYFLESIDAFENNDDYMYGVTTTAIGELYFKMEAYATALSYFRLSAKIRERLKRKGANIELAYWYLGETYYAMGKKDSALYYYNKSNKQAKLNRESSNYANEGIAQILVDRGDFNQAIPYLKSIEKWYLESNVALWVADLANLNMRVYYLKKDDQEFYKWRSIAREAAFREYLPEQQKKYYLCLSDFFNAKNNSDSAYYFLSAARRIDKELNSYKRESNIDNIVQAYDKQKQELKLLKLEADLTRTKLAAQEQKLQNIDLSEKNEIYSILVVLSILITIVLVLLSIVYYRQRNKISEKVDELVAKEERIRNMQMNSTNPYAILSQDLSVEECNDSFKSIVGCKPNIPGAVGDMFGKIFYDDFKIALRKINPFEAIDLTWIREDGDFKAVNFKLIDLTEDSTVKGYVLEGVDVTDKIKAERVEKDQLKDEIRKKEVETNTASQQAALTSLKLELKNDLLHQLINDLDGLSAEDKEQRIEQIKKNIKGNLKSEKNWDGFLKHFDAAHTGFFGNLKSLHPHLTTNEEKHCAFLKMKLNNKEVASLLGITPESVKKARQRLKKKLGLKPEDSLKNYVDSI